MRTGWALLRPTVSFSDLRMLALAGLCGLLLSVAFAPGIPHAFAAPAAPRYAESYYVSSTNTSTASNHGCSQGHTDAHWGSNSMVILDFGGQVSSSTVDNWFVGDISNGTVEAVAAAFARGYASCGNGITSLVLVIGTNNSISGATNASTGAAWAHVAATVQSYGYHNVSAWGGNDFESWCPNDCQTGSGGINWANGYSNAGTDTFYVNFGSADNCPTNSSGGGTCQGTEWTQYDYWYVSWGARAADVAPQIYHSSWANQWQQISLYGYLHQSGRSIQFEGPLAESDFISTGTAWSALWNALNSDSRTATTGSLLYLLRIQPLSSSGW